MVGAFIVYHEFKTGRGEHSQKGAYLSLFLFAHSIFGSHNSKIELNDYRKERFF